MEYGNKEGLPLYAWTGLVSWMSGIHRLAITVTSDQRTPGKAESPIPPWKVLVSGDTGTGGWITHPGLNMTCLKEEIQEQEVGSSIPDWIWPVLRRRYRNRRLDHPSRIEYDLSFRNHVEPGTFNTLQGGASSGNKMNTTANPGRAPLPVPLETKG